MHSLRLMALAAACLLVVGAAGASAPAEAPRPLGEWSDDCNRGFRLSAMPSAWVLSTSSEPLTLITHVAVDFELLSDGDYEVTVDTASGERHHELTGYSHMLLEAVIRSATDRNIVQRLDGRYLVERGKEPVVFEWAATDLENAPVKPGYYEIEVRGRFVPTYVGLRPEDEFTYSDLDGWSAVDEACTRILNIEVTDDPVTSNTGRGVSCAAPPAGYYSTIDDSSSFNLRSTLHPIIDDHTSFPYSSTGTDTWDILNDADEDPSNTVQLLSIYKNEAFAEGCSSGCDSTLGWNREHTWAKSYGFSTESGVARIAYTDTHHLRAADRGYNSTRNNIVHDWCTTGCTDYTTDVNNGFGGGAADINRRAGGSTSCGNTPASDTAWQTWPHRRGDVARTIMYMDIRYEGGSGAMGTEQDLIASSDRTEMLVETTSCGDGFQDPAYHGVLSTLVDWAIADPPDADEIRRNDQVWCYQGNRNPFVDNNDWVSCLYLNDCAGSTIPAFDGISSATDQSACADLGVLVQWPTPLDWRDGCSSGCSRGFKVYRDDGSKVEITSGGCDSASLGAGATSCSDTTGTDNIIYTYTVEAFNDVAQTNDGGTSLDAADSISDGNAPTITVIPTATSTASTFAVEWSTDEAADSYLEWGTIDGGPYGSSTSSATAISIHSLVATGLSATTTYFYRACSSDPCGNGPTCNPQQEVTTTGSCEPGSNTPVFINEIHYDNTGGDTGEFVEIAGPAGTDLGSWTLELYNGLDGALYDTINLSGSITNEGNGYGAESFATAGIDNGSPDGLALIDDGGFVVQFLCYEGTLTATSGTAIGTDCTDIGITEPIDTPLGESLQLIGIGFVYEDLYWSGPSTASPGTINSAQDLICISQFIVGSCDPGTNTPVFINEFHYDNGGSDVFELVEVAGPAGTDLSTGPWRIELYNGGTTNRYANISLSGIIPDEGDSGFGALAFSRSGIQNGAPDGIALIDNNGLVVQFLCYEGTFTAGDSTAAGVTCDDVGVDEQAATPSGYSLQLAGSGFVYEDFTWAGPAVTSTGTVNVAQRLECGYVPLPVRVSSFTASGDGSHMSFTWTTATEVGNVGFDLLVLENEALHKVNHELIPSQGMDSTRPQHYSYTASGIDGVEFHLVDVDVRGRRSIHGPYPLGASGRPTSTEAIPWNTIAAEHRLKTDLRRAQRLEQEVTSVNLAVTTDGLHKVTFEDLLAEGIDWSGVDSSSLALVETIDGRERAVAIRVDARDRFGSGASIEFVGQARASVYSENNLYTLRIDPGQARRIDEIRPLPTSGATVTEAPSTTRVADELEYSFGSPTADPWYMAQLRAIGAPDSYSMVVPVNHLAGNRNRTALLTVELFGITDWPATPDHHVALHLNGRSVAEAMFDGRERATIEVEIPSMWLVEGDNLLEIELPFHDLGVDFDLSALDSVELIYPRSLFAERGQLTFTASGASFQVENLPSAEVVVYRQADATTVRLMDVTVLQTGRTYTASFTGTEVDATYFVASRTHLNRPSISPGMVVTDLFDRRAEYLIISHPDFSDHLRPLVQLRSRTFGSVRLVDLEQVYLRYNGGMVSAEAIAMFIREASNRLGTTHVLLVGGDSYDYKDHLGVGAISFLPSLYVPTGPLVRHAPADPLYGDLDGDGVPDLAVGRLPVRTSAEIDSIVSKILAYENKSYGRSLLSASDAQVAETGLSFRQSAAQILSTLPTGWAMDHADIDLLGVDGARSELVNNINLGVAMVQYFGHSSPTLWSYHGLFSADDAAQLDNPSRPTVVTQWGCWNTYYVTPEFNTMAHKLMLSGDRGAATVLGAATLTSHSSDVALGRLFTPLVTQSGLSIGSALVQAKQRLASRRPDSHDVIIGWTILGDPGLRVDP